MKIVDSLDPRRWSAFVQSHPSGSIFHTPEMFEVFQSTRGHVPLVLAVLDTHNEVLALLVSVKVQTLPWILGRISSRAVLYAEPISCRGEAGTAALKILMKEHDRRMRNLVLFTEVRPLSGDRDEAAALAATGYEHGQYLNYVSDVRLSPEELVHRMSRHGRRELRKGQRQGLCAEEVTSPEGIEMLYALLQDTFAKARVPLAPKELLLNALRVLSPSEMLRVFVVKHDGNPVAGSALLFHNETAYFWFGGMRRIDGLYAMEVVVFAMLESAHLHKCKIFDYGGAGQPERPYGVRDFKAKFGGDLVNYGRYRKVYSPWKFALAERAYEASRRVWGRTLLSDAGRNRA